MVCELSTPQPPRRRAESSRGCSRRAWFPPSWPSRAPTRWRVYVRSHLDRFRVKTGRRRRAELTRLAFESGCEAPE